MGLVETSLPDKYLAEMLYVVEWITSLPDKLLADVISAPKQYAER